GGGAGGGGAEGAGGQRDIAFAGRGDRRRTELVLDRLGPEHHGEDREDRPFERVGPTERVPGYGAVELPVAEPEHPADRDHHGEMPGQPLGRDQEAPAGSLGAGLGQRVDPEAEAIRATPSAQTAGW